MVLDGTLVSGKVRAMVAEKTVSFIKKTGHIPTLAVILVGNNPASEVYVRNKKKAAEEVNFKCVDYKFPENTTESELSETINALNDNEEIDGILVQLPLPEHIDSFHIMNLIEPGKDVDGFTPANKGLLSEGKAFLKPCTPKGIMIILNYYDIDTYGKNICVVGRSVIVGRPMADLLIAETNATVTVCNSHTENLKEHLLMADIIICAAGKAGLITADMVKEGAVVIDVGINRIEDSSKKSGYKLVGDTDFEALADKASAITPVPGGIGPMTIASLLDNTLISACKMHQIDYNSL